MTTEPRKTVGQKLDELLLPHQTTRDALVTEQADCQAQIQRLQQRLEELGREIEAADQQLGETLRNCIAQEAELARIFRLAGATGEDVPVHVDAESAAADIEAEPVEVEAPESEQSGCAVAHAVTIDADLANDTAPSEAEVLMDAFDALPAEDATDASQPAIEAEPDTPVDESIASDAAATEAEPTFEVEPTPAVEAEAETDAEAALPEVASAELNIPIPEPGADAPQEPAYEERISQPADSQPAAAADELADAADDEPAASGTPESASGLDPATSMAAERLQQALEALGRQVTAAPPKPQTGNATIAPAASDLSDDEAVRILTPTRLTLNDTEPAQNTPASSPTEQPDADLGAAESE